MAVNGYKFTVLTGGGAGALDAQDGAGLGEGDIAIVMVSGTLYLYQLSATSGAAESSPAVIAPDTNAGNKRWLIQRIPQTNTLPVGSIVAYVGGYFTNGANGGYTAVTSSYVAGVNSMINADGFYVCDGAALNLAGSTIFNGSGRYLPNLTDSRFLMGYVSAGVSGGLNTSAAHTHTYTHNHYIDHTHTHYHTHYIDHTHGTGSFTLTTNEMPSHSHLSIHNGEYGSGEPYGVFSGNRDVPQTVAYTQGDTIAYTGGGAAHNHGSTGTASIAYSADTGSPTTSTASLVYSGDPVNNNFSIDPVHENRPLFLSCFYIMKVI